jgi:hypothetical protein
MTQEEIREGLVETEHHLEQSCIQHISGNR